MFIKWACSKTQWSSQKQETKTLTMSEMLRSVVHSLILMSDNASTPSVDNHPLPLSTTFTSLHFSSLHFNSLHFTTLIVQYWEGLRDSKDDSPQARKYSFVVYVSG